MGFAGYVADYNKAARRRQHNLQNPVLWLLDDSFVIQDIS
jgi:hypothetical protein